MSDGNERKFAGLDINFELNTLVDAALISWIVEESDVSRITFSTTSSLIKFKNLIPKSLKYLLLNPEIPRNKITENIVKAVKENNYLSIKEFTSNVNVFFGKLYYNYLITENNDESITYGEFLTNLVEFVTAFKNEDSFEEFWKSSFISKIVKKEDLHTNEGIQTSIQLLDDLIEKDREILVKLYTDLEEGRIIENTKEVIEIIRKIINLEICYPEVDRPTTVLEFKELDLLLNGNMNLAVLGINTVADLIRLEKNINRYLDLLFSVVSPLLLDNLDLQSIESPHKPNPANKIARLLNNRTSKFSDYRKGNSDSLFTNVVVRFFENEYKFISSQSDIEELKSKVEQFYVEYPNFAESKLLQKYLDIKLFSVPQTQQIQQQTIENKQKVNVNGMEVDIDSSKIIVQIIDSVRHYLETENLDVKLVNRLNKKKVFDLLISEVLAAITASGENLEKIKNLLKNNRKVFRIKKITNENIEPETIVLGSFFDEGTPGAKAICAFVYKVNFLNNGDKTIDISIRDSKSLVLE